MSNILDEAALAYLSGETITANEKVALARGSEYDHFAKYSAETVALQAELDAAMAAGTIERPESFDKYTEAHSKVYWESAKLEFETHSPKETANALVYRVMLDKIGDAIARFNPGAVLDFGCACGLPLFQFAKRFSSIEFHGVDRAEIFRALNDENFQASNLSFRAGSVWDAMPATRGIDKMLMHVRTGLVVYPAFIDRLYAAAAAHGFRYVALYETASLSCISWTFRDQGSGFRSEAHRSTMFIHDYASALRRAGFDPFHVERMPHGYALKKNNMLPGDTYVLILARI